MLTSILFLKLALISSNSLMNCVTQGKPHANTGPNGHCPCLHPHLPPALCVRSGNTLEVFPRRTRRGGWVDDVNADVGGAHRGHVCVRISCVTLSAIMYILSFGDRDTLSHRILPLQCDDSLGTSRHHRRGNHWIHSQDLL